MCVTMIKLEQILDALENSDLQFKAFIIDENGLDHQIDQYQVVFRVAENKFTVKIEDLEQILTEYHPKTVHCFVAPAGATSFDTHKDPCDVTIYCIEGIKSMIIDDIEHDIQAGETLFIPKNTPHRAINKYKSVMLSIGD
jgi:mannose-6-phosphate isomerase-like protein (cupin superfamily)